MVVGIVLGCVERVARVRVGCAQEGSLSHPAVAACVPGPLVGWLVLAPQLVCGAATGVQPRLMVVGEDCSCCWGPLTVDIKVSVARAQVGDRPQCLRQESWVPWYLGERLNGTMEWRNSLCLLGPLCLCWTV